ncbi:MAG: 50S ribosomal protein L3 [Planctomycetaceae bacterium]|nr:50S ribosomal protein L3 [Planctomycetaceae bacterium]
MPVGLLGKKIGMTQVYDENGVVVPVTVIEAGPCVVTKVCTAARDGYSAVQLGFGDRPRRLVSRADRGQVADIGSRRQKALQAAGGAVLDKAGCEPKRFVREFRCADDAHGFSVGQVLTADAVAEWKFVDVVGTSKGRGFTGVMKRHNFSGQRASHGAKRVHRRPGSIGASADPSRVMKGMRMAGRYGGSWVTVRNLKMFRADADSNTVLVHGAIPGANGSFVVLRSSARNVKVVK